MKQAMVTWNDGSQGSENSDISKVQKTEFANGLIWDTREKEFKNDSKVFGLSNR